MATHPSVESDLNSGLKLVSGGIFLSGGSLHRTMTREHGRALETIGHAVDYLNDSFLYDGPDDEIIDFSGPQMDAVRLLIAAQRQVLRSLPLAEPLRLRVWKKMLRRKSPHKPTAVVPLSSSK